MTHADNNLPDDTQRQVPERLATDLRRLAHPGFAVPEETDARIADISRRHFAAVRRRRFSFRWVSAAAAAAAVLLVVLWVNRTPECVPYDVNADRRLDILDAYALQVSIDRDEPSRERWDVTGDGVVDREDVKRIALAAVALPGEKSR